MKKIISSVLSVFAAALIFANARPSLDGRAVVCEDDELPKGLFAKTIGYLPGDSVTVTNPANGSVVDVLVLGSIDSSEGIAILLSPQAAERLEIKKDSNVQVKITKRTGSLDENASGTAVLADESSAGDFSDTGEVLEEENEEVAPQTYDGENTEKAAEEKTAEEEGAAAENSEAEITETSAAEAESAEDVEAETAGSELTEPEAEPVFEEPGEAAAEEAEPVSADESDIASASELVAAEPVAAAAPLLPADAETEAENVEETAPAEESEPAESVEIAETAENTLPEENAEKIDGTAPIEETEPEGELFEKEALAEAEPAESEAFTADTLGEAEPQPENAEEVVADVTAPQENPGENAEKFDETAPAIAEEADKPETVAAEGVPAETESEDYAPIVLVPAELNPPEENTDTEDPAEETEVAAESVVGTVEIPAESVAEPAETVSASETEKPSFEKFVTTENSLEKGRYYLQIATLGNAENIQNLVTKYGEKYPVVLVQLESKAYRVLIGPLTADEFGMIKERFTSYGFKDAFLRKIK